MNIWHDIPENCIGEDSFTAVIEISKGGKNKYELDKQTGLLRLDRVLYTSTHYPANYGVIPRTFAEDDDPLDGLVICAEPINPMTLVQVYPIGVIHMLDGGRDDDKIIAIPVSDPTYHHIHKIEDLPPHIFEEMIHFFKVYKQLEHKETDIRTVYDAEKAMEIIREAIERYRVLFPSR